MSPLLCLLFSTPVSATKYFVVSVFWFVWKLGIIHSLIFESIYHIAVQPSLLFVLFNSMFRFLVTLTISEEHLWPCQCAFVFRYPTYPLLLFCSVLALIFCSNMDHAPRDDLFVVQMPWPHLKVKNIVWSDYAVCV